MSCKEIQEHLDDYLDGSLAEPLRPRVEAHLGSCLDCRRELKALRAIVEGARDLPSDIRPRRDLWPEIDSRLASVRPVKPSLSAAPGPEERWWPQLAAAAITLLVLAVPVSVWWAHRRGEEPSADRAEVFAPAALIAQAELAHSEDGVMLARTDLMVAIERHRDVVEDDMLRVLQQNMVILDRAIGEIRSALEQDPQNRRLRMLLATRYQQERRLLHRVSRV